MRVVLVLQHPTHRLVKIVECFDKPGVAVGVKAKRCNPRVLARATAVGAALFADRPVQKPVAQEPTKHGERRCIRVSDGYRRIGASTEVHLRVGDPEFPSRFEQGCGAERGPVVIASRCVAPQLQGFMTYHLGGMFIGDRQQLPRHRCDCRVHAAQSVAQSAQCIRLLQTVVECLQAPYPLEPAQPVVDARQTAHAGAGGGHGEPVAVSCDGLFAARPRLADQLADARILIETRLLQRVAHQLALGTAVACQGP